MSEEKTPPVDSAGRDMCADTYGMFEEVREGLLNKQIQDIKSGKLVLGIQFEEAATQPKIQNAPTIIYHYAETASVVYSPEKPPEKPQRFNIVAQSPAEITKSTMTGKPIIAVNLRNAFKFLNDPNCKNKADMEPVLLRLRELDL